MSNGGIIGPTNDPVINDLITTATSSTPGFAVNPASSTVSALIVAGGGNANSGGQAGAGGAGGYRYFASIPVTGGNPYPLVVEEVQVEMETLEGLHHQKVIQVQELHPDQTAEKHQEPVEDQLQQEQ